MRAGVYGRESQGNPKSIGDQLEIGHELCAEQGWTERIYSDEVSASWYGRKPRGGWAALLADLDAGELDVVVLWESSRGERRLTWWSTLLDTCSERGVLIHLISHERTYNPRIPREWETLANEGVKSQAEANQISIRSKRGASKAAEKGRPPAGPCPYGYRRVYDQMTGQLTAQETDPDSGPIVTEIFERVARSEPLSKIVDDLNNRGVTPPGERSNNRMTSQRWYRERVRKIAQSRTYLGERKHKANWHSAPWPALTDHSTFADAQRVLSEPARLAKARPGRQVHLLTYFALCRNGHPVRARADVYTCDNGCVWIKREPVDELITELAILRLSDPELYKSLKQAGEAADADLTRLEHEKAALAQSLDAWRESARRGKTTPDSLAVVEAGLTEDIERLAREIEAIRVPQDLQGFVGPKADVEARWAAATIQAKRTVLRALRLKVALQAAPRGFKVPIHERVLVDWQ